MPEGEKCVNEEKCSLLLVSSTKRKKVFFFEIVNIIKVA